MIPEKPTETERVDYELTYYVNDVNTENTQVLMEYGKRDELKNVYTYGIERISVETITDVVNTTADEIETDFYLYDGRGSVANVVSTEAEVLSAYTYDPFGNVTSGAPEFGSFYGYNAEDTNPVTGLQYLRARYYDTESGRFHVQDQVLGDVAEPLTLNRYAYVINNPLMYKDESGDFLALIGAAAGGSAGQFTGTILNGGSLKEAFQAATDPKQLLVNVVTGAIGNGVYQKLGMPFETYLKARTTQINQQVQEYNCGSAPEMVAQDPVDTATPDVPDNIVADAPDNVPTDAPDANVQDPVDDVTPDLPELTPGSGDDLDWSIVSKKTGETRTDHVKLHEVNNLQKESHGVFYGDSIEVVTDAWNNRGSGTVITENDTDIYVIPRANSGYAGGYSGQGENLNYVTIVTEANTNQIIAAFPGNGYSYKP